jgi:hypothetical protein
MTKRKLNEEDGRLKKRVMTRQREKLKSEVLEEINDKLLEENNELMKRNQELEERRKMLTKQVNETGKQNAEMKQKERKSRMEKERLRRKIAAITKNTSGTIELKMENYGKIMDWIYNIQETALNMAKGGRY